LTPTVPLRPENQTYDVVEKVQSEGTSFSDASRGESPETGRKMSKRRDKKIRLVRFINITPGW